MKLLLAPLLAAAIGSSSALASTFTVTNANNSGAGSLRQAILDANAAANVGGTPDRIAFAIPGAGVHTIEPLSSLPSITEALVVDGFSQPGTIPNSNTVAKV